MNLKIVSHVDDFLVSGRKKDLAWLRACMEKEFEITSEVLGPDPGEVPEVRFLGRVIRWTSRGYEYEGDPKHATTLLKEWGLEDSKVVKTPGVHDEKKVAEDIEDDNELDKNESRRYRRAAGDIVRLKRVIRYIKGAPNLKYMFLWQDMPVDLQTFSDSDWAGCVKSRKSTSGGICMLGWHCLHHWSSTQATVAASSGEAELNPLSKAVSETIGLTDMIKDCGYNVYGEVLTDSSAANSIVHRRGCGKVKHLETRQLWAQEKVMSKRVGSRKIPRDQNHSDALTHHWTTPEGIKHFPAIGCEW